MDRNGFDFVDLITDADQILLYNMVNVHTTSINGQQLMQELIDEEIELLQKCVYGCPEHQPNLQQHESMAVMGSEPKEDIAVSEEKSESKEEFKETSEDTQTGGVHCTVSQSTEKVDETEKGVVKGGKCLKRKVSQSSDGSQDGP